MLRAVIAVVIVVVARIVLSLLVGWVAHRRRANASHVIGICNLFLFGSVYLAFEQFHDEGLTLYGLFFSMLMLWVAYSAARVGVIGVQVVNTNRRAP